MTSPRNTMYDESELSIVTLCILGPGCIVLHCSIVQEMSLIYDVACKSKTPAPPLTSLTSQFCRLLHGVSLHEDKKP